MKKAILDGTIDNGFGLGQACDGPDAVLLEMHNNPRWNLDFTDWRLLRTTHLVIGKLRAIPGGKYAVEFQLADVFGGKHISFNPVNAAPGDIRRTAHQISDAVYEQLTGERGAFVHAKPGQAGRGLGLADDVQLLPVRRGGAGRDAGVCGAGARAGGRAIAERDRHDRQVLDRERHL